MRSSPSARLRLGRWRDVPDYELYLGAGDPAARLAQDRIRKVEVFEYPELGMEAVWRIAVIDDKGNDFFNELNLKVYEGLFSLQTRKENYPSDA